MLRFMICDDDSLFCQRERQFIREYYGGKAIETGIDIFSSGEEIIGLGEKISKYDAIFVDADMENLNGMELASYLRAASPELIIVFVSSNLSYALDGYKVGAVRYIMKDDSLFQKSMEECLNYILQKTKRDVQYITITDEKNRVSVEKILYVESKAHKVTYYLVPGDNAKMEYTIYGKLDEVEEELKHYGFLRTHQSYLVNMSYAKAVSRYKVELLNGMEIQISKKYYKTVEEEFIRIKGTF